MLLHSKTRNHSMPSDRRLRSAKRFALLTLYCCFALLAITVQRRSDDEDEAGGSYDFLPCHRFAQAVSSDDCPLEIRSVSTGGYITSGPFSTAGSVPGSCVLTSHFLMINVTAACSESRFANEYCRFNLSSVRFVNSAVVFLFSGKVSRQTVVPRVAVTITNCSFQNTNVGSFNTMSYKDLRSAVFIIRDPQNEDVQPAALSVEISKNDFTIAHAPRTGTTTALLFSFSFAVLFLTRSMSLPSGSDVPLSNANVLITENNFALTDTSNVGWFGAVGFAGGLLKNSTVFVSINTFNVTVTVTSHTTSGQQSVMIGFVHFVSQVAALAAFPRMVNASISIHDNSGLISSSALSDVYMASKRRVANAFVSFAAGIRNFAADVRNSASSITLNDNRVSMRFKRKLTAATVSLPAAEEPSVSNVDIPCALFYIGHLHINAGTFQFAASRNTLASEIRYDSSVQFMTATAFLLFDVFSGSTDGVFNDSTLLAADNEWSHQSVVTISADIFVPTTTGAFLFFASINSPTGVFNVTAHSNRVPRFSIEHSQIRNTVSENEVMIAFFIVRSLPFTGSNAESKVFDIRSNTMHVGVSIGNEIMAFSFGISFVFLERSLTTSYPQIFVSAIDNEMYSQFGGNLRLPSVGIWRERYNVSIVRCGFIGKVIVSGNVFHHVMDYSGTQNIAFFDKPTFALLATLGSVSGVQLSIKVVDNKVNFTVLNHAEPKPSWVETAFAFWLLSQEVRLYGPETIVFSGNEVFVDTAAQNSSFSLIRQQHFIQSHTAHLSIEAVNVIFGCQSNASYVNANVSGAISTVVPEGMASPATASEFDDDYRLRCGNRVHFRSTRPGSTFVNVGLFQIGLAFAQGSLEVVGNTFNFTVASSTFAPIFAHITFNSTSLWFHPRRLIVALNQFSLEVFDPIPSPLRWSDGLATSVFSNVAEDNDARVKAIFPLFALMVATRMIHPAFAVAPQITISQNSVLLLGQTRFASPSTSVTLLRLPVDFFNTNLARSNMTLELVWNNFTFDGAASGFAAKPPVLLHTANSSHQYLVDEVSVRQISTFRYCGNTAHFLGDSTVWNSSSVYIDEENLEVLRSVGPMGFTNDCPATPPLPSRAEKEKAPTLTMSSTKPTASKSVSDSLSLVPTPTNTATRSNAGLTSTVTSASTDTIAPSASNDVSSSDSRVISMSSSLSSSLALSASPSKQQTNTLDLNVSATIAATKTVTYVPPAPLVPIKSPQREANEGSQQAVGIVTGSVGIVTATTAGSLGVANAMGRLVRCDDNDDDDLPIMTHPLRFRFGDSVTNVVSAAVLSNCLLFPFVIIVGARYPVLHFVKRYMSKPGTSEAEIMAALGWPSLVVLPFVPLGEGVGVVVTRALRYGEPLGVCCGIIGVVVVAFVIAAWVRAMARTVPRRLLVHVKTRSSGFSWFINPMYEWEPLPMIAAPSVAAKVHGRVSISPQNRNHQHRDQRRVKRADSNRASAASASRSRSVSLDALSTPPRNSVVSLTDSLSSYMLQQPQHTPPVTNQLLSLTAANNNNSRKHNRGLSDDNDSVRSDATITPSDAMAAESRNREKYNALEVALLQSAHMLGEKRFYYAEFVSFVCSLIVGVAEGLPGSTCKVRVVIAFIAAVVQAGSNATAIVPVELFLQLLLGTGVTVLAFIAVVQVFGETDASTGDIMDVINAVSNVVGLCATLFGIGRAAWDAYTSNSRRDRARRVLSVHAAEAAASVAIMAERLRDAGEIDFDDNNGDDGVKLNSAPLFFTDVGDESIGGGLGSRRLPELSADELKRHSRSSSSMSLALSTNSNTPPSRGPAAGAGSAIIHVRDINSVSPRQREGDTQRRATSAPFVISDDDNNSTPSNNSPPPTAGASSRKVPLGAFAGKPLTAHGKGRDRKNTLGLGLLGGLDADSSDDDFLGLLPSTKLKARLRGQTIASAPSAPVDAEADADADAAKRGTEMLRSLLQSSTAQSATATATAAARRRGDSLHPSTSAGGFSTRRNTDAARLRQAKEELKRLKVLDVVVGSSAVADEGVGDLSASKDVKTNTVSNESPRRNRAEAGGKKEEDQDDLLLAPQEFNARVLRKIDRAAASMAVTQKPSSPARGGLPPIDAEDL